MNSLQRITSVATILIALPVFGQENNPTPPGGRIRLDAPGVADAAAEDDPTLRPKSMRLKSTDLPQISVIDKLLSIESALGAKLNRSIEDQWVGDYNELYQRFREDGTPSSIRGGGKNTAYTAMALGVKASDAVLALKARNIEALKHASDQIEVLARKLGATEGELGMTNTVKIYANKNQWFNAFLALGRLQRDMLGYLKSNPKQKDQAVLVIVGGWLQGGRCVTHVIDKHYDDNVSNILREQRLVDLIRENMEKLEPGYLNDPLVADILKALPEIRNRVNVGLRDPVKQEDVKWLHHTFDDLVTRIMTVEEPVAAPAVAAAADGNAPSVPEAQRPASSPTEPAAQAPPSPPTAGAAASPAESGKAVTHQPAQASSAAAAADVPQPAADAAPGQELSARKSAGFPLWPVIGGVLLVAAGIVFLIRRKAGR